MKNWAVSDTGDKWSVMLDIRDLGGHLDSTFRARAVTLGFRMSVAIPRVRAVAVFPMDFVGRLRILRTMHLPACAFMVLRPLLSLFPVYGSSGLPFAVPLCLVVFVWLTLVLF